MITTDPKALLRDAQELLDRTKADLAKFDRASDIVRGGLVERVRFAETVDQADRRTEELREHIERWRAARMPMVEMIEHIARAMAELSEPPPMFFPMTPHQRPSA